MEYTYLMHTEEMERITQEYLSNNLDEIFARVSRKDVALMILNNAGEENSILFPARWLESNEIAAWDPDYTKVTQEEAIHIAKAEASGFVPAEEVDWDNLDKYAEEDSGRNQAHEELRKLVKQKNTLQERVYEQCQLLVTLVLDETIADEQEIIEILEAVTDLCDGERYIELFNLLCCHIATHHPQMKERYPYLFRGVQ